MDLHFPEGLENGGIVFAPQKRRVNGSFNSFVELTPRQEACDPDCVKIRT